MRATSRESYARIEEPAKTTYRGYTVYKHGFGSQGPVLLQALNILENFDLHAMGYASADYLHTVTEALKLAYADRDRITPIRRSCRCPVKACCRRPMRRRRGADRSEKASTSFIAGDPTKYDSKVKQWTFWKANVTNGVTPRTRSGQDEKSPRSSRTPRTWR